MIFVFGSNLAGVHGRGAARHAMKHYGAIWGKGIGHFGNSYAIPTKDENIITLPLERIKGYVDDFVLWAKNHPNMKFYLTRVGCGLAGYTDEDIAPLFADVPENVIIPESWIPYIDGYDLKHEYQDWENENFNR